MVTLAEAKADFSLIREWEPKEDNRDFKVLWHCNFWDGPLSGVMMFEGREHWFETLLEGPVGFNLEGEVLMGRVYAIVLLTDEQIARLRSDHEDFQRHVGTHTDYTYAEDGSRSRAIGAVRKDWEKSGYFERAKTREPLKLSENEVVGWWGRTRFDYGDLLYDIRPHDKVKRPRYD